MLSDRLAPWIESLQGDVVAVSHGGVARVLMTMLGGLATERAALADVWQGRVLVFDKGRFDWI
jgi:probable phosphoglycerate mutase